MCRSHKAEAFSWAFCHAHQNLAEVHGMCGACLLSFAADGRSNLETYRSLTGKLGGVGIGDHGFGLRSASEGKVMEDGALCSCCSLPLEVVRSCPFVVLQRDDSGIGGAGEVCRDVLGDRCDDEVAMAMITRLQEEKAAARTEAAQYRRVMEEQSAYDREDAQRLAGEVRGLEAEVERCRAELRDQGIAGEIRDHMRLLPTTSRREEFSGGGFGDEENAYISKQLRKLTDKLHRFSNSSQLVQEPDPTDDDEQEDGDGEEEEEGGRAEASEVGRRVRNADNFTKWQQLQSMEVTNSRGGDDGGGESADNMAGLEEEISELSGRLQALEADRSFLEHSVNSLRNGREGEAVIHDIARSLRELRMTLGNDVYDR